MTINVSGGDSLGKGGNLSATKSTAFWGNLIRWCGDNAVTHNDALAAFLGAEIFERLQWSLLTDDQRAAILSVFRVGLGAGAASGSVSSIEEVIGHGRVVICEDGSQWAACGDEDAERFEDWGEGAVVAIHRGLVYRLDPDDAAEVELLRL